MENWIQEALFQWKSSKVKLNSQASISQIEKAEAIFNFKFPDDFKQLYLIANGFEGLDWQQHMFSFWSLERMIDEYNENNNKEFIGFCDFLIMSHEIGYKKDKTGVFKLYPNAAENEAEKIAEPFDEVVFMINNSSDLIY